jgi:hypothetical protein
LIGDSLLIDDWRLAISRVFSAIAPRKRTDYSIGSDGKLTVSFGWQAAVYIRGMV